MLSQTPVGCGWRIDHVRCAQAIKQPYPCVVRGHVVEYSDVVLHHQSVLT